MAEFTFDQPGGGTPSPGSHGSHGKKKGLNKMYLYIGGAVVIMLYIVFIKRTQSAAPVDPSTVNYPTNSTDVASQLQNNADILQGNMAATLNQFQSQLASDYGTQLNAITAKMDGLQGKMDELNSHPAPQNTPTPQPAPTPTPQPAPAAAPAPSGPNWKGSLQGGYSYATPRGGWNGGSVVDYLKSHGYAADYNSRASLAGAMGIGGYNGSASQNVAMLNNLRNAGV